MAQTLYKLVFLGPGNSGKTSLIHRHLTGEFYQGDRTATIAIDCKANSPAKDGSTVHRMAFMVEDVEVKNQADRDYRIDLDIYEANAPYPGLFDHTSGIVLFLEPRKTDLEGLKKLIATLPRVPLVVCRSKCDIPQTKEFLKEHRDEVQALMGFFPGRFQYYEISSKSNYNFEKPFLHLLRKIQGTATLQFTGFTAVTPPEASDS